MNRFFKFLIISSLIFCANKIIAQTNFDPLKEYEIGGIQIKGTEYLDTEILKSLSGLSVGDKITIPGEKIQSAIHKLWDQGLFSNIAVEANKVVNEIVFLDVILTERARLSKYKFTGLRKVEEDELREKLNLMRGRVLTENVKRTSVNTIKNYFVDKGFLTVSARIEEQADTARQNHNIVNIIVNRGEKVKIKEIVFDGNDEMLNRDLKKNMRSTKEKTNVKLGTPKEIAGILAQKGIAETLGNLTIAEFWDFLSDRVQLRIFSTSKYIEKDFDADKLAILSYYNTKGYRDAKIVEDTIYLVNEKEAILKLRVEEGKKYYFRNIGWEGNTKFTDEQLSRVLGIEKGEIYDQSRLDEGLFISQNSTDVSALYMDDGYLFFSVVPTEQRIDNDSIDLLIKINEGPQATIRNVTISGNTKTNEHVIRRELRTIPGNKFSRSDIIRSQRELAGLGYFDAEQIGINPIPNPQDGTVDIEYSVVERASDQFELSAGWGGTGVVGSAGITFNNFSLRDIFREWDPVPSGDGQRLSLRYQSTGRFFQSLNASFTEPWLGGKTPTSLSVGGFSTWISNSAGGSFFQRGGSVSIGKRVKWPDDFFTAQAELSYQYYRLDNYQTDFAVNNGIFNNLSANFTISRFSVGINPVYPTEGSNITFTAKFTPPYSRFLTDSDGDGFFDSRDEAPNFKGTYNGRDPVDITEAPNAYASFHKWTEYYKWKIRAEWFTRVKGDLVLRTSAKMGFIGNYTPFTNAETDSELFSPFERFELGGDGIANFNISGKEIIALRGYEVEQVTQGQGGDPFYNKFTVELRYPLSLNPNSTIYTLAFLEGGNTWTNFKDWNAFELRRSAGLGLRFFLPMFGTIGFDYGVGFDKSLPASNNFWGYLSDFGKFSVILGQEPE